MSKKKISEGVTLVSTPLVRHVLSYTPDSLTTKEFGQTIDRIFQEYEGRDSGRRDTMHFEGGGGIATVTFYTKRRDA